ncbi:MAG: transposase family protein [Chloroflexi bacterium]|nr:transposase family protein [Chloroflexota bacterium]
MIEVLSELMVIRLAPGHVRSDNGPEYTARAASEWLGKVGPRTLYIESGAPWENGYIKSTMQPNAESLDETIGGQHADGRLHRAW